MAEQRVTQNSKQADDPSRVHREEQPLEQAEEVIQSDLTRLQQTLANPAAADPDDIAALQQSVGNRGVSRLVEGGEAGIVQAKLQVGAPGDKYEREADRVADKVMNTVIPTTAQPEQAEAQPHTAEPGTVQRFQTLAQIDEAIRKKKERQRQREQQQKRVTAPPKTEPTQPVPQTTKPIPQRETERSQIQKRRTEVGNDYSRRNMERWQGPPQQKPVNQQVTKPDTDKNQVVEQKPSNETLQQPRQQQTVAQNKLPEQKLTSLKKQQQQVATDLANDPSKETLDSAIRLIRQGSETEEKRRLKQMVRDLYGKKFSKQNLPGSDKPEQSLEKIEQKDEIKDEIKDEVKDEEDILSEEEMGVFMIQQGGAEAAEEEEEVEEAEEEEVEEAEEEETEEEETEEEEETAAEGEEFVIESEEEEEDWSLEVLLARPEAALAAPRVQREEAAEELKPVVSFANPDHYQQTTEKRAATTRIAREEPGIPGLKGVSEDIWLKPLAGLTGSGRQPEQDDAEIQAKPAEAAGGFEVEGDVEQRLMQQKSSGRPLPDEVRSDMENRFGADFSQVRIHTGSAAAEISDSLHAQAFTHGHDIFFNAGKSDFATSDDKRLLAHELTHVIQQMGYGKKDDSTDG